MEAPPSLLAGGAHFRAGSPRFDHEVDRSVLQVRPAVGQERSYRGHACTW